MKKAKTKKVRVPGTSVSMVVTSNRTGGTKMMPSQFHGMNSRRTERRKARQEARVQGWDS